MSDIRKAMAEAIYGQESNSGRADTSKVNDQGVTGPMQVQKGTFDGLKRLGLIPQDYDFGNPEHTKAAGIAEVNRLAEKFNDDPAKVFAAYYAGEKVVNADGTINRHWGNKKHPDHPTVGQYIEQASARMGKPADGTPFGSDSSPVVASAGARSTPGSTLVDNGSWTASVVDRPPKADTVKPKLTPFEEEGALQVGLAFGAEAAVQMQGRPEQAAQVGVASLVPPAVPEIVGNPVYEAAVQGGAALEREEARRQSITAADKIGLASLYQTLPGTLWRRHVKPDFPADPRYTPSPELFKRPGLTEDDMDDLRTAGSKAEEEYILFQQQDKLQAQKDIFATGAWSGLGWSIVASLGDPVNVLGGYAAAKTFALAGVGSVALASQGRSAAAAGSAFAENAAFNVLNEAAQDALGEHRGASDYFAAAAMSLIPATLAGAAGYSAGEKAALRAVTEKALADSVKRSEALLAAAQKNLPEGATKEQLLAEMGRLDAAEAKGVAQGALAARLPESRRLLPEEEVTPTADRAPAALTAGMKTFAQEDPAFFDKNYKNVSDRLIMTDEPNPVVLRQTTGLSEGVTWSQLQKSPERVIVGPKLLAAARPAALAAKELFEQFLPNSRAAIGLAVDSEMKASTGAANFANGKIISAGNTHFIGLRPTGGSPTQAITTAVHEVGHAIFHEKFRDIPPGLLSRMVKEHGDFLVELKAGSGSARFKRFHEGSSNAASNGPDKLPSRLPAEEYTASFDEYTAEAFVRFVQRRIREEDAGFSLNKGAIANLKALWEQAKKLWEYAKGKGYLPADEAFDEFFDRVLKGSLKEADDIPTGHVQYLDTGLVIPSAESAAVTQDPFAAARGIDLLPVGSEAQKAEAKAILHLHKKAAEWEKANPMDEAWMKRVKNFTDNSVFNVASTGLIMLSSKNPVVRMVASELLEDASNVAGNRNSTAAISKWMHEQAFMGNTINDMQSAYAIWRKEQGGTAVDDFVNGNLWLRFNRDVAAEIEARKGGNSNTQGHAQVQIAANALEAAYERMRGAQTQHRTLGWASLPESSKGYMPHRMSSGKVRAMTAEQTKLLHSTLVDQFIGIEGWDMTFSDALAAKYIDRVKQRALGAYDSTTGVHQVGAADIVEDALTAMGLTKPEVKAQMERFMRGSPGYTKRRIQLDLNAPHTLEDGSEFKLIDLFETDQLMLLRGQAQRVSGEVALARHGIMGKSGLALLRRSMGYHEDGKAAQPRELEAFDQVSAEFLGEPFGTVEGKWMERARLLNSVARLGGIVFNQFAEFINAIAHVGVGRTLSAVTSIPRLRGEIIALSKGQKVDNSLLKSLEVVGGAEFGTSAYKMVFPFDAPDHVYPTYGRDTITATDRVLRGAGHLQAKVSLWRAVHSSQQRGMAEQIVAKAARYMTEGKEDQALADMGITASLRARLGPDLSEIAKFEGGRLVEFDLTKARDKDAGFEFAQAVHRGVSQIIQGTFIGEQGKWAHSGWLKMLTQFRTFSITSMEKQWGRQRNNQGTAKALGLLLGSMSIAAPIYMARVYTASIGRSDQEEYLEKQLAFGQIARATLNYVALSGLSGDFLDALTAVAPSIGETTGGRSGANKTFVGNLIAPAAGYVDDAWQAAQNLDDPEKALKLLPGSRIPFIIPAINALGD